MKNPILIKECWCASSSSWRSIQFNQRFARISRTSIWRYHKWYL